MFTVDDQQDDEYGTTLPPPDCLYATELQNYLNEHVQMDGNFNLVQWWRANKLKFPALYKLFMKSSFTPASSSTVESEFSYTGLVITDRRSRLLPEHVSDIMVARNDITL